MQSDAANLFGKLGHIAVAVENALNSGEYQDIGSLLSEHQEVMGQLMDYEPFEQDMKPAIEHAEKNVRSLLNKVQIMQDDVKKQLSTMNKKKLIQSAYHV